MSRRHPASFIALSVSKSVVTRDVHDQVRLSGFNCARLLDIESVVVEEKFFYLGPIFLGLRHFSSHIIGGTLAPGMSAEGLWPQAKRTLGWTSAGGVQRDIRMQQKRHVVARHIEVSLVNVGYVRQGVEVLNLRRIRIVHGLPVFQIRDSRNLIQRLSV